MKKFVLSILIVAGLFVAVGTTFAATANASATIVSSIAVAQVTNKGLRFGTLVSPSAEKTVIVGADDSVTNADGLVRVPADTDVGAAQFTVTGEATYGYAITVPSGSITISNGTTTMSVGSFTASKASGTLTAGTDTFKVGGTLTIGAAQATGSYTGTFDVTVAYN